VTTADPPKAPDVDVAVVGGGLAGGLAALRLHQRQPDLDLALLEKAEVLAGGPRTWSFHASDLPQGFGWVEELASARWPAHEVRFPGTTRRLEGGYRSIRSSRFDRRLREVLGEAVRTGATVERATRHRVHLADGDERTARCVVDARPGAGPPGPAGAQAFVGWDVRLAEPHDVDVPVIMDATVPQRDGFRFLYVLPWGERRALVEDTRYAAGDLDRDAIAEDLQAYLDEQGWTVDEVERREAGVLPIPLEAPDPPGPTDPAAPARVGTGAGLFHWTTGYSLPDAARVADRLARLDDPTTASARQAVRAYASDHARRQRFFALLNRLLFQGARPEERRSVMERFYRLPRSLIEAFYAGRISKTQQARVLLGRPPIPVGRALRAALGLGPELEEVGAGA